MMIKILILKKNKDGMSLLNKKLTEKNPSNYNSRLESENLILYLISFVYGVILILIVRVLMISIII